MSPWAHYPLVKAQKQNLDKSHENMAIQNIYISKSPWAHYPLVKAQKGTIVHHFYRNNFDTHYSKF